MAYDTKNSKLVLFGGYGDGATLNDTWVWNGSDWQLVHPSQSPPARMDHALAYDPVRQAVILFGGIGLGGPSPTWYNDTWLWNGANWTPLVTSSAPPVREGHKLVFDSRLGQVILQGGATTDTFGTNSYNVLYLNDTWALSGSTWTNVKPATAPRPSANHGFAYDTQRQQGVLFAGFGSLTTQTAVWSSNGPGACSFTLAAVAPNPPSFDNAGGNGTAAVTAGAGCAWTATSSHPSWLVTTSAGSGNGTVNYTVAANAGAGSRSGTITAGGQTLAVTQTGVTVVPPPGGGTPGSTYLITTTAGTALPATALSGTSVSSIALYSVAADSAGNTYFAARYRNAVFKLNAAGVLTLVAGNGTPGFSGDGGAATSAQLNYPMGVAVDAAGALYIADTYNSRIRKITLSTGAITTVAGNGTPGFSGDGGAAISAQLSNADYVAVDAAGNLYIADRNNHRIRKVTVSDGVIKTVAGNGAAGFSGDGGVATSAALNYPAGMALDAAGNLYIADSGNERIRKVIGANGVITTVAGNGATGFSGDGGAAVKAALNYPSQVAVDAAGTLYIVDQNNHRIRKVSAPSGAITTVAGNGAFGYSGDGGAATSALLSWPEGVAVDSAGALYVTDSYAGRVRKVSTGGIISTVLGGGAGDGSWGVSAHMARVSAVARDSSGNLYISTPEVNRVKKLAPNGVISTIAGNGAQGFAGDGGAAVNASLYWPSGVAVDASGNLYFADFNNSRIRKVTVSTGTITTVAGDGYSRFSGDGGAAVNASLYWPTGVAADAAGNLYIADKNNHRIRKVTASTGVMTTVAGNGTAGFSGDGGAATGAALNNPFAVAVDASGNLYVADYYNFRIRKVTVSNGLITTVAGNGESNNYGDGGAATRAALNGPSGVAVDATGNLYIADSNSNRIRKVTASNGTITTVAGGGSWGFYGDGGVATGAGLTSPMSLAIGSADNIYVADSYNGAIRLLTPAGTSAVLTVTSTHSDAFAAGQSGTYILTVTNAPLAGSTSGTVTVTEALPGGLTLVSMSGSGWSCSAGNCSRGDSLSGGSSYPAITVTVNVSSTAPEQVTNQVSVSGGGAAITGAQDLTLLTGVSPGTGPGICSYSLAAGTPNPPSFTSVGGSGTATVTAGAGCPWTATSSYPSWLATTSTGSGNGTVNYTVAANTGTNSRTGTISAGGMAFNVTQSGGAVAPPSSTPVISAGGVVNTASYAPGGPPSGGLAQGSFFTIYGSNLGPDAPMKATGYPLPSILGGVGVQVTQGSNKYNAPLVFVSKNQINAILPSNVPTGRAQVIVNYNTLTSQPIDITVAKTRLGLFFQRVNGTDLAIAQNEDYRLNLPDTPARPGQVVILWGTGLGPITGADNSAPGSTGDMTSVPVTITVGGMTAQRMYAGRQSETAAVDNIYFTVPTGVPSGCHVPMAITAGGVAANTTSIAISADGSRCVDPPAPACVSIAGEWLATETGTLTCTITVNGESETDTDSISGGDIITMSQQGCQVSYTSRRIMSAFGAGKDLRQGIVEGANVRFSGIMGELAPGFTSEKNLFEASGALEDNVINLTGSGTLIANGVWEGMNMKFSCTARTTATLKKWP
jgi:trimeric autotransporter adhesin